MNPRFDICRGIRQGCPLSPFLFLLVTPIMATHIKNGHFQGRTTLNRGFKLSQLGNDRTNFLSNRYEVIKTIRCTEEFSAGSALKMNLKSALLPLKDCDLLNVIPVIPVT